MFPNITFSQVTEFIVFVSRVLWEAEMYTGEASGGWFSGTAPVGVGAGKEGGGGRSRTVGTVVWSLQRPQPASPTGCALKPRGPRRGVPTPGKGARPPGRGHDLVLGSALPEGLDWHGV